MTPDKVREVLAVYRRKLEDMKVAARQSSHQTYPVTNDEALGHCHAMLDDMETFIQQGRMDKIFRWLGFIQGVMWRSGVYTIGEMKDHSRPK